MCGINAILDWAGKIPDKRHLVAAMNSRMVYRGPDGEGVYADSQVALGMRRLSIIDVSGGNQPIFNEDGSVVVVCNGEIYNYVELREGLVARGHHFTSCSDVETIVHLYEEKGEACLADLRGMFAFVLWDKNRRRLFAARDRLGIKPLYFSEHDGAYWLSSELKTIVHVAGLSPSLRPASVLEFLHYSHAIDQRHTPVEEVRRVLPGEFVIADESGFRLERYWTPRFGGDPGIANRSDGEILATLDGAVRMHLRSDVPVGVLLSGGLDASTLAALAARVGTNYSAISAGYSGNHAVDERRQAGATARYLGLPFIEVESNVADFRAHFSALVKYCDEPVGDIAAMAQWALYRQARSLGFKVLLSGLGGDEVFFGYPPWNDLGHALASFTGDIDARVQTIATKFSGQLGLQAERLTTGGLRASANGAPFPVRRLLENAPHGPDEMAALLFGTYLVHNGCQLADKLGMGCSVEVRVPLLDHRLVEDVFALPLARRFEPGKSKPLLRRLMQGILPEGTVHVPKRGFSPPSTFIEQMVTSDLGMVFDGVLARSGWLNLDVLKSVVAKGQAMPWLKQPSLRHRLGIAQPSGFLFLLIAFEHWYHNLSSPDGAGWASN
jgi:asparagine synthase (glutamine-hydrolysing)